MSKEKAKGKSVLDNVPIKGRAFPLTGNNMEEQMPPPQLGIVGSCPHCGAPVYGERWIPKENAEPPKVVHSCGCWRRPGTVQQSMETK